MCLLDTPVFNTMNVKLETKFGEPLEDTRALPFSPLLPTSKLGLLYWRLYVRERCLKDKEFRRLIMQACEKDCVFFINTFVYFHEVRETEEVIGVFPVSLDGDQKDILAVFQKYCGKIDGVVDKTRGIGLSYLVAAFCIWLWLFRKNRIEVGLVSKDDMSLDMKGRPSTLMGKLDTIFDTLPAWMKVNKAGESILHRTHTNHRFEHKFNQNVIQGYTSSDEKLRSARLNMCFVDEAAFLDINDQKFLASGYGTCPSIWWVSTHNGSGSLFHRLSNNETASIVRLSTYWWNNPRCRRGLYRSVKGRIELLDSDYQYPGGYKFSHEYAGKLRSPWVDRVFDRAEIDAQTVFEELYGVAAIESHKLIRPEVITLARNYCTRPVCRGDISEFGDFIEDNLDGPIYFWREPALPFTGFYYLGADSALGVLHKAFAAISVIDAVSGEQVVSAAFETCPPTLFATKVVALAKIITGARGAGYCPIVYESTGINVSFANELKRLQWPAVYKEEGSKNPGMPNRDRGLVWLMELGRAVASKEVSLRDDRIIEDLEHFEIESKKYELIFTGRDGHGDLAIATSMAWWAARRRRQAALKCYKGVNQYTTGIEAEPLYQERKRKLSEFTHRYEGILR